MVEQIWENMEQRYFPDKTVEFNLYLEDASRENLRKMKGVISIELPKVALNRNGNLMDISKLRIFFDSVENALAVVKAEKTHMRVKAAEQLTEAGSGFGFKPRQGAVGIGGVTRTVYDGWCGVDGVARQFMGGKITADMIEKVELAPSLLTIEQIDSNGDRVGDDALLWINNPSKEDLNFSSSYGSATIDGLTATVTGKKGYFVDLCFNLYITLKSGYRMFLDDSRVSKLDDPRASVYFYLRISAASTTGWYGDAFCGLEYWPNITSTGEEFHGVYGERKRVGLGLEIRESGMTLAPKPATAGKTRRPHRKGEQKMYIDADIIIKAASLFAACGALIGAVIAVYKQVESNKKQSEVIKEMQEEQTIICYNGKTFTNAERRTKPWALHRD